MTRSARAITSALAAAVMLAASCSDDTTSDPSSASSSSSASAGGSGGDGPPANSCVQPGDVGNDHGVGQYCTPVGGECAAFAEAPLCLASVGQDQWFCTRIGCDETTDCGSEAGCLITASGSACVPCRCDDAGIGCGAGVGGAGVAGGGGAPSGGGGSGG